MKDNTHSQFFETDPRLTAYALGEMDAAERAAFEAEIANDPAAQAAVAEIRAFTGQLESVLAAEPLPEQQTAPIAPETIGEDWRAAREAEAAEARKRARKNKPFRFPYFIIAGVATACFAVYFSFYKHDVHQQEQQRIAYEAKMVEERARRDVEIRREAYTLARSDVARRARETHQSTRYELDLNQVPYLGTESYTHYADNKFQRANDNPLSTFSADVDTAGYTNVRRFLNRGQRPPRDSVRIEEMVNYFSYNYAPPAKDSAEPFAATMEVAAAPWNPEHRLVRIGIKGREIDDAARPPANLVFLLDISGSMDSPNKLPLVKESMRMLVNRLRADDRIAIVTYANNVGVALYSTPVADKTKILDALDALRASGGTNGGGGIQLAYEIAKANFIKEGANRVILCTDGDFNIGVTSNDDLAGLIGEKAKSGVFLSVLGFGMGNYKDARLQTLANKGNGNHGYIDTRDEARRLLVEQTAGTLVTIAKDVKLQVEFNPLQAESYRLIGYEKRLLAKEDFNNDKVDAGEIGAGHTVTALYEVIPAKTIAADAAGNAKPRLGTSDAPVDSLKYQTQTVVTSAPKPELKGELLTLKIRYKAPSADISQKLEFTLEDKGVDFAAASPDFKFTCSVAAFAMLLRDSEDKGLANYDSVLEWADAGMVGATGAELDRRNEFTDLVRRARQLPAN